MSAMVAYDRVWRLLQVRAEADLIRRGSRWEEEPGLFARYLGNMGL